MLKELSGKNLQYYIKLQIFPEEKILPVRYARHLYDVYNMGNSWVKESDRKGYYI